MLVESLVSFRIYSTSVKTLNTYFKGQNEVTWKNEVIYRGVVALDFRRRRFFFLKLEINYQCFDNLHSKRVPLVPIFLILIYYNNINSSQYGVPISKSQL